MPPPYVPNVLVDNSDNERDAEDHQRWCLRNLQNPVVSRATIRTRHAPLELVSTCYVGPLSYSPWCSRHCCPSKRRQVDASKRQGSRDKVQRNERVDVSKATPQKRSLMQASKERVSSGASGSVMPSTIQPDMRHATSLQEADTLCHQSSATSSKLSRQVSVVRAEDREECASASQLLATMMSGDGDQEELDRVPVTPEVLQGQPSQLSVSSTADIANNTSNQPSRPQAFIRRSSLPIVFDDNADSPLNGDHSVSSAIPPQPGIRSALESLSDSFRPEGDEHDSRISQRASQTINNKRKANSPEADDTKPLLQHDDHPRPWREEVYEQAQEQEQEQGLDQDQDHKEYQSQEESVLSSTRGKSRTTLGRKHHTSDDDGKSVRTPKKARHVAGLQGASHDSQSLNTSRKYGSGNHHGSFQQASASGPSPPPSSPIEPEHSRSASLPTQHNHDLLSYPTSSSASTPLMNLSVTPQSHCDGNVNTESRDAPVPPSASRQKEASRPPNQSSLDVHLLDIEGYLERDLKGYASRLSY